MVVTKPGKFAPVGPTRGYSPGMEEEHERNHAPGSQSEQDAAPQPVTGPEQDTSAGGDDSSTADRLPGLPSEDDSPLGDTDQHSEA
jgi:hypothetical protein